MNYIAESKNVKVSPRKVRLVVDSIKAYNPANAIISLSALNKRAATPVRKTLQSALSNAVNNFKVDKDNLIIREIMVNEGITYKRYHYAGRGRVRPYKRRASHIRVILTDKVEAPIQSSEKGKEAVKSS